jgi:hypothetical protein
MSLRLIGARVDETSQEMAVPFVAIGPLTY